MKGSRSMMRTPRIGKVELDSTREHAGDGGLEERGERGERGGLEERGERGERNPRPRLAKGTSRATPVPRPLPEEEVHGVSDAAIDDDDPVDALILASPLAQLDLDDPDDDDEPLPRVGVAVDLGTRPLMGLGTRPYTAMRAVVDAAVSARWAIAYGPVEVKHAPAVQPPPADRPLGSPATISGAAASPATSSGSAASPTPRGNGRHTLAASRVVGILLLAASAVAVAVYVMATAL